MIYCEKSSNGVVGLVHYMPFDEVHGFGKTMTELEITGFFVDSIPIPEQIDGKIPSLRYTEDYKLYYEYIDRPLTLEEKIQQLEKDLGNVLLERTMDKAKISKLEITQGDLLLEIASLKTGGAA